MIKKVHYFSLTFIKREILFIARHLLSLIMPEYKFYKIIKYIHKIKHEELFKLAFSSSNKTNIYYKKYILQN